MGESCILARFPEAEKKEQIVDWMVFISEQWLLVSLLLVLIAALVTVEKQRAGTALNLHEVTRLVNSDQAILVDLRDKKDYSAGHIVDALNIPYAKLQDRLSELEKHRDKTIVVLDKMGQHAGAASKVLREKGFTVARMQGGMVEWQSQNLPLVKG